MPTRVNPEKNNDGSCIRLWPEYQNHVWAYDFVFDRTRQGRPLKLLNGVDEFTRECLAIEVAGKQTARDVLRTLAGLMLRHGIPKHIGSDNGPEFVAQAVSGLALEARCRNAIYRTGQSLVERLHRKLQRQAQR